MHRRDETRTNPADIARAALRRLAEEGVAPTPNQYRRAYLAVAPRDAADRPADSALQRLARSEQAAACGGERLRAALEEEDWKGAAELLAAALLRGPGPTPQPARLGADLAVFVREWERSQVGLSHVKKLQALEQIEAAADAVDAARLLRATAERWSTLRARPAATGAGTEEGGGASAAGPWKRLWFDAVRMAEQAYADAPDIRARARELLEQAAGVEALSGELVAQAHGLWDACEHWHELSDATRERLAEVFRLLLDNVAELFDADHWVQGQLAAIHGLLQDAPDVARLEQAVAGLKDLLYKQGVLRKAGDDAREVARELVDMVVRSLGVYVESSARFGEGLQAGLSELETAEDWDKAKSVVRGILQQSEHMLADTLQLREAFAYARANLEQAHARAEGLQRELREVSELIQQDPLTGALNRRGLELAFRRESARAERDAAPLSVSMLDLDHFKRINDQYGHDTGDEVLRELVRTLRAQLRPTDVVARLGGEEFMILLPGEDAEQARQILSRVQTRFNAQTFEHPRQPAGIRARFSAGVTAWQQGESFDAMYARVDGLLLHAKEAGRNRIEVAVPDAA